jgi:hypothetical protein
VFYNKIGIIFITLIIFLLSLVSIVQAAPPVNGITFGDTLDLNDDGETGGDSNDAAISEGYNLGNIMSGRKDANESGDASDDDGTDGDVPDDDPDGDDSEDENGDDADEGDAEDEMDEGMDTNAKQHPVAAALAEYFAQYFDDVSSDMLYDEIMDLHEAGNGFGTITKAYYFGKELGIPPSELLDEAKGVGWGNVLKQNDIHPGAIGNGNGKRPDKFGQPTDTDPSEELGAGPPGQIKKGNNPNLLSFDASDLMGQNGGPGNKGGNGNGKGNGNGGGHGRGRSKK